MLNPETNEFEQITQDLVELYEERPETREWAKFKVGGRVEVMGFDFEGEELVSKGWFTIRKITKKDLILRPMRSSSTSSGTPE